MLKSGVWKCYIKRSNNEAQCSLCFKVLKTGGGTTNLRHHLKSKHPQYLGKKDKASESSSASVDHGTSLSGRCSSPLSETLSSSSEGTIPPASSTPATVGNRSRSPTPSSSRQITLFQSMERKASFDRGGKRDAEITNALIFMICKDNTPHSIVEKEGFKHFTKTTVPLYKLPSRNTVTEMVSSRYIAVVDLIKATLASVLHVSLSADICTVTNTSKGFLVVTAHFIATRENSLETVMLGVRRLYESHTAANIAAEVEHLLDFFSIPKTKVVGICTDGGANMIAGVRKLLGDGKNIYCCAHLLNLVVLDGLEDENNKSLKDLLVEIKSIVTFAKHSNVFMENLRAEQRKEGTAEGNVLLLIQSVPTRWNSTYHMLQRFIRLSPYVSRVLANPNVKNAPRMVSSSDMELLTEVVSVLLPLNEGTKEISGTEYITGSLVIPLVACIETALNAVSCHHTPAKKLRTKLADSLKQRAPKISQNHLLSHATLLDPRFKKKYMDSKIAAQAVTTVAQQIREFLKDTGKLSPKATQNAATASNHPLWSAHDREVVATTSSTGEFPNELSLYLNQPLQPRSSDPVAFWQQSKTCMPGLSFVALRSLTLIGSSVASERLISTLNDVVSDKRASLTDAHISERVFMSRLSKKYWVD